MTRRVELVLEPHEPTTDDERGIASGWLEGTLSARGRVPAAELGERRRDDGSEAAPARVAAGAG